MDDAAHGDRGRDLISTPENLIFFSAASVWEMRIKQGIGKLDLPEDFADVLAGQAFEPLAVTSSTPTLCRACHPFTEIHLTVCSSLRRGTNV